MSKSNEHPEVVIENCWFKEEVRLTNLSGGPALVFMGCVFEKGLDAQEAEIGRSLKFIGCVFKAKPGSPNAVNMENTRIKGDLLLLHCSLQGCFYALGLRAENYVQLLGCKIAASLSDISDPILVSEIMDKKWSDAQIQLGETQTLEVAINLRGAKIEGNLEIQPRLYHPMFPAVVSFGGISIDKVTVGGDVVLTGVLCYRAISIQAARVNGNIALIHCRTLQGTLTLMGTKVEGDVRLEKAEISNELSFMGATINGVVQLTDSEVKGHLFLYRTIVGGNINLLGLSVGGDLNLAFATVRYFMTAFYMLDSGKLFRSKCLSVGGDLILSGAEINAVELRGAEIKGTIKIITGIFQRLIFTLGINPVESTDDNSFNKEEVKFDAIPCRAEAVIITAVTIKETLNVAGLEVTLPDDVTKQKKLRIEQEGGILIIGSTIGLDLTFFMEDVRMSLERRCKVTPEQTVAWHTIPTPLACASRTWGKLVLRANKIGGHLDLRNMDINDELDMSDTVVGLDVNVDAGNPIFERFKTTCLKVNAEKLECNGDLKLSGLRVEGDFVAWGMKVRGEILFLPIDKKERKECVVMHDDTDREKADASPAENPPKYALIKGTLDLTSVKATHLMLSGENLGRRARDGERSPTVILERGNIERLEVVKPHLVCPINLTGITVNHWVFSDPLEDGEADQEATAEHFNAVLKRMRPFDRSIWIEVENKLRNQAQDSEANKIYIGMRCQVRQKAREEYRKATKGRSYTARKLLWLCWDRAQFSATRYGTQVWRPMIPALLLFLPSLLLIFWGPHYVRASPELLQVLGDKESREAVKKPLSYQPDESAIEISPSDLNIPWTWGDTLALTLRYQVPIIPNMTHQWWEASGRPLYIKGIGNIPLTAEQYAFGVEIYHWVAWSLFLIGAATQVFRGKRS